MSTFCWSRNWCHNGHQMQIFFSLSLSLSCMHTQAHTHFISLCRERICFMMMILLAIATLELSQHLFTVLVARLAAEKVLPLFGQVEKICLVTQNLPTLRNLGPFQVIEGIPNIEALTQFLPLGIGGFRLKLSLRLNTGCIAQGYIGCLVEYQANNQFPPWSSKWWKVLAK